MSTIASLLLTLLGLFLFSFFLWRKLKEDYGSDRIFTFTLWLFIGIFSGVWLAKGDALLSSWLPVIGTTLVSLYFIRRYSFRPFELLDALSASWFYLSLFLFSAASLKSEEGKIFLAFASIAAVSLLLHRFFEKRYRRFSWYPSGKVGFVGLGSFAVYFFLRGLVEIFSPFVLFSNSSEILSATLSLVLALSLATTLYLRSGNERAEKFLQKAKTWQIK